MKRFFDNNPKAILITINWSNNKGEIQSALAIKFLFKLSVGPISSKSFAIYAINCPEDPTTSIRFNVIEETSFIRDL